MEKYKQLIDKIDFYRHRDIFKRFTIEKEEYCFSILTGSHMESAKLGTIEMAILKNNEFVFNEDTTDESIIHYMSFEIFKKFVNELVNTKKENLEKLFLKYKEEKNE